MVVVIYNFLSYNKFTAHREVFRFTNRWLIQLQDLVSYKATTYLVVLIKLDSCNDLGFRYI